MFTLGDKIALGMTAAVGVLGSCYGRYVDNQHLSKYNMTAKEYFDTVMESKTIEEYRKRINKEEL